MSFSAYLGHMNETANPFISCGKNCIKASLYFLCLFSLPGLPPTAMGFLSQSMKAKLITARKYTIHVQGNLKWVVLLL